MKEEEKKEFNIDFNFAQDKTEHIIKVIGVGGGGGNAVRNMFEQGVKNVGFAICNTDSQALSQSPVPVKIQLGPEGLGVGGDPKLGKEKAEESIEDVKRLFDDDTQMVFITAGMGGGTGTGAAPVIAKAARERGILTVGVVTLPFKFEKKTRIEKALIGIEELKKNVDSLLVINNERLLEIYSDNTTTIVQAFAKADEVLTIATKSIAEIITVEGIVNRDFKDVETVMKNGGGAIVSVGYGEGENRILKAMSNALQSPLLNLVDIEKAQRLLYIIYTCENKPVTVTETSEINQFMDTLSNDLEVLWGLYRDEDLDEQVKVTIVATGFDQEPQKKDNKLEEERRNAIKCLEEFYYPNSKPVKEEEAPKEETIETPVIEPAVESERISFEEQQEVEEAEEKVDTNNSHHDRKASWLKKIIAFVQNTLEEE